MERKQPNHSPYVISESISKTLKFDGIKLPERDIVGGDNIFLILPTSLCSGQVAVKYANDISFFKIYLYYFSLIFFLPSKCFRK